jgi:hypothetical protein
MRNNTEMEKEYKKGGNSMKHSLALEYDNTAGKYEIVGV